MTSLVKSLTYTVDFGILGENDLTVFYNYTPAQAGRYSGPPEDCYPDEPEEIEIVDVSADGVVLKKRILSNLLEILQDDDDLAIAISENEKDEADEARADYEESQDDLRRMEQC